MKSPILILTLAACVCLFGSFSGDKHKHKSKTKTKAKPKKHIAAAPAPIPTDRSVCAFNLQFEANGKKSAVNRFVSTDIHYKYGVGSAFYMLANFKDGKKFEVSYVSSDKAPTPRYQLMRASSVKSRFYIRFTQADHSELYFSGYDVNFLNTHDGIRCDIPLMTAGHNTMQGLHILLMKGK